MLAWCEVLLAWYEVLLAWYEVLLAWFVTLTAWFVTLTRWFASLIVTEMLYQAVKKAISKGNTLKHVRNEPPNYGNGLKVCFIGEKDSPAALANKQHDFIF